MSFSEVTISADWNKEAPFQIDEPFTPEERAAIVLEWSEAFDKYMEEQVLCIN